MRSTVNFSFILILVVCLGYFSFAQQKDSVQVEPKITLDTLNTQNYPDSTDSSNVKAVNKDSVYALDSLSLMKKRFDSFKYGDVISIANRMLLKKGIFKTDQILNIYKMKGISHYSLSEDDAAKKSFIEILRVDTTYKLDTTKISPKIIAFYKQVKQDYIQQQKEIEARTVVRIDTVLVPKVEFDYEHENKLKEMIVKSIVLPGWGHIDKGENFKGIVLMVLSSAAIISSVYYIIDVEKTEKAYLVETDVNLIESKYRDYNASYKMRNFSLISFGILWVYAQLDLLFNSGNQQLSQSPLKNTGLKYQNTRGLTLYYNFSF
jgi:hypothetical protein